MEYANVMQKPMIEKVVANIGVGESGERLGKAEKLLELLTGRKPVRTVSTHKIPTWNIRKGEPIGCKVTLRGDAGEDFLKRAFSAIDTKITPSNFDRQGNLAFGITEYIDFPNVKYDPEIGIFGLNVTATIKRPGFRVTRRKEKKAKIPVKNTLSAEESIEFIKEKFGVEVERKE
ncbi:MAG: 50S ribosomal protein L5 [Candidatus Altiarchaeota archaeon]